MPSEQNQELFSRYHRNVRYVPLGIDPEVWYPIERPKLDEPFFNFLICGGGIRKGVDLVVNAFNTIFPDGSWPSDMPVPRLIIKSPRVTETYGNRIDVISGFLPPEEERMLYAMANVYVQPSRGEGFGLQPLQAIAQGCPTIATDAHGHKAYSHLITYPLGWTQKLTPEQSFHHGPAGSWWEPSFSDLCEAMEDSYYNYQSLLPRTAQNGTQAGLELNWDQTASGYLDVIGRDRLLLPDIGETEWVEPTYRRYRVRVKEPHLFEVGGTHLFMEPGKDYWEAADVKRILYDAHILDPACLEDDGGLLPHQIEEAGAYMAAASHCPTCGGRLNPETRRSVEEILEGID